MGSGASSQVNSTAEIAKLRNENAELKQKLQSLQKSQPKGKRMTMAVRDSTTEKSFQRPNRRVEISAEVNRLGKQWDRSKVGSAGTRRAAL